MFIDITDVLVNYKYFLDRWFESFNVNVFFLFSINYILSYSISSYESYQISLIDRIED